MEFPEEGYCVNNKDIATYLVKHKSILKPSCLGNDFIGWNKDKFWTCSSSSKPKFQVEYLLNIINEMEKFKLPEKWYIKSTEDTYKVIYEWLRKNKQNGNYYDNPSNGDKNSYVCFPAYSGFHQTDGDDSYKEITFEQFKKYVLNVNREEAYDAQFKKELTVNDLIEGEIYVASFDKCDIEYIFKSSNKLGGYNGCVWNIGFSRRCDRIDSWKDIKIATQEEKDWLEACIKANKFIPKDEVMKKDKVVHCTTQEEWDFVSKKLGRTTSVNYLKMGDNRCIEIKHPNSSCSTDWAKLRFKILSFQEWLDENNYTFNQNEVTCETCNGEGKVMKAKLYPSGHTEVWETCPDCNGYIEKEVEMTKEEFPKIGTKVKITSTVPGCYGALGIIGIVTDEKSNNGLSHKSTIGFNIKEEDSNKIWRVNGKWEIISKSIEPFSVGTYIVSLKENAVSITGFNPGCIAYIHKFGQGEFDNNSWYMSSSDEAKGNIKWFSTLKEAEEFAKTLIYKKFEIGKWYKLTDCTESYRKCSAIPFEDILSYTESIDNSLYDKNIGIARSLNRMVEVPLSEIQQYLPDGHPDKIVKSNTNPFKVGDLVRIVSKDDLRNDTANWTNLSIGDTFVIQEIWQDWCRPEKEKTTGCHYKLLELEEEDEKEKVRFSIKKDKTFKIKTIDEEPEERVKIKFKR